MANYFEDGIAPVPFLADEDLTTYQYKLVKITASDAATVEKFAHKTLGSACPLAIGVLQNDPSAGQEARVKAIGFTKVLARASVCDLAPGAWLTGASDGLVEPASAVDGTDHVLGRWFGPKSTTVDASVYGNMLFLPSGTCAAVNNQ